MRCYSTMLLVILSSAVAGAISLVSAQDAATFSGNTISVQARAKVTLPPRVAEITGIIHVESEFAGDALTKYQAAKQSTLEAINKLAIPNLKIETTGFAIGPAASESSTQAMLNRARGVAAEPPKVTVQETIRIRLESIHKIERNDLVTLLAKIFDTAKQAGVHFGPSPTANRSPISRDEYQGYAMYLIDDTSLLREEAEAIALRNARSRAEKLALAAGCRLGEIRAVREMQRTSELLLGAGRGIPLDQTAKLEDIEVTAHLDVSFVLLPPEGAAGPAAESSAAAGR